jgi:triosephosphate isomerase
MQEKTAVKRRLVAGTGWKMNNGAADALRYGEALRARIAALDVSGLDLFVLPPFTSLHAAAESLAGSTVAIGGQNMHWEESGSWTGEISASMLREAGCRYVELAHSERLQHFAENYPLVRLKVDKALQSGLTPIICLGESAQEKRENRTDAVLSEQVLTSIAGLADERVPEVILAYEPRWAIGGSEAAAPDYVAARHKTLRYIVRQRCGADIAERIRIIYGGSVTPENGKALIELEDVDGLFVGRAAWQAEGFARIIELVHAAAREKSRY